METKFRRIAIVNRGEAAMRIIHAVREFNHEHGTDLRTIALFTQPDRQSMFVREADESFCLGPAHERDSVTKQLRSSYLDYELLRNALTESKSEAAWVGWGFVAEHADFADLCRHMGIVFIGPSGEVMRRLGDKISAKKLAEKAKIPVAKWSGGPVETVAEAYAHAERLGYPVFIKASAGGGGRGIRQVNSPAEMARAFEGARNEAFKAFGDPTVFLERRIDGARHVEVQIIADQFGTIWPLGTRDCTLQRRQQKVMEEAPCPVLTPEQDLALRDAAVRMGQTAAYVNAGTVEFLYLSKTNRMLFMEMNTRLQVEHPVTECTTGADVVKLQLLVAQGQRLEGMPPATSGHAIEVRLNAEDPSNGFAPAPGILERFRISTGPGVRVDTGFEVGDVIPAEFDSMIAKIVGFGRTREEALARLRRALHVSTVVVNGGTSNRSFLMQMLARPEVHGGNYDVAWLDRITASGLLLTDDQGHIALFQSAIDACDAQCAVERTQFYVSALQGRPEVRNELGHRVELRYQGHSYSILVYRLGVKQYRLEVDGSAFEVQIEHLRKYENALTFAGKTFRTVSIEQGSTYRVEVDGVSHSVERDEGGIVRAPSPSVVVSIPVKPGDNVQAGDRVAVLEAMKMEIVVSAPFSGVVRQIVAIANVQVGTGAPLLQIDPASEPESQSVTPRLQVSVLASTIPSSPARPIESFRQMLLGFDVKPEFTNVAAKYQSADEDREPSLYTEENRVLEIFADICALFRNTPRLAKELPGESPSAEACLFWYLRSPASEGEGLPPEFTESLRRAVRHYGVESLQPSSELQDALVWIYKSHCRIERQVTAILRILQHRLDTLDLNAQPPKDAFSTLLDRLIAITRAAFPLVSDLARELRYRCFEQPQFEAARMRILELVDEHLDTLASSSAEASGGAAKRWLVECPQPLAARFSKRFARSSESLQQLMLEVLMSRYYCVRRLDQFRPISLRPSCCVATSFVQDQQTTHVLALHTQFSDVSAALHALGEMVAELPQEDAVLFDILASNGEHHSATELQQELNDALAACRFSQPVQRIVIAVAARNGKPGNTEMQYFTYEPSGTGYQEVQLFRGVHPATGDRLHLWRLGNFNITRLPSIDDIFVMRAIAKSNSKDERLFAVAEVRDLTPIRDESGKIVSLPYFERMFAEAVASIRREQSTRSVRNRLYWNRIFLYVWPTLNLTAEEMDGIVKRLAPSTDGLGLEQVIVRARIPKARNGELRDTVIRISAPGDAGILMTFRPASKLQPMRPLAAYEQKVIKMRQRGLLYPYEIIRLLTPPDDGTRSALPPGEFTEYDLDNSGSLVPVAREHGENKANVIVGVVRNFVPRYPEGMTRVMLLGDPNRDLGAIAEPECRRIMAGLDLAEQLGVPLEWFPVSAGAKISMESGVENMDWIARVLKRLIEFTQAGGEINIVVNGINVGAQPYWNAEATMLMHTRGILIMTPKGTMVLTGKRALDYSGSVSAEDNHGIGGYDRIMGVNGQAQYFARDIDEACQILMRHYEHTYIAPGESFPRRAITNDPLNRDVRVYRMRDSSDSGFNFVGEIFSDETNPGRKRSFDIRSVMLAVSDQDHAPLERFAGMRAAETTVVWDAHLGGYPVCMIGIESKPLARFGFVPADGPDHWTGGTLFPMSSKKVSRAINAASNNRPVVILANLSGFDGSPESMRRLQLEYGAEIGRAVVNFKGPMIFCVISRYHGGAYVVFSRTLNPQVEVVALEGTYASVIGGAPAAAVVFASEVESRTRKDSRLEEINRALSTAEPSQKAHLTAEWDELYRKTYSEKLGEMATEFDAIHSVNRALKVGAIDAILPPADLRPFLIAAIERGIMKQQCAADENRLQHETEPTVLA
ncbi:Carbamoyl-phosphate synthase L chain, ATP-binding protein [Candidatus Koribacter versatilis Ellin345]|uniref:Carbamoyl-phosphate synthase L chain, ATP-binding protein n=1 Tax=Koribacter versatilis (strain Ellin345) TaxID=204669 RepID=Q1IUH9_KORVE|nr:biotin carboxylase N-terminal domain-containing protein [Candidatus Koribacter versatilis]ABF39471.1 Carbamoyl-phosphate synthase L chain, ATP-binding protein [Candidatus Koribacter versatilis Ellin345]